MINLSKITSMALLLVSLSLTAFADGNAPTTIEEKEEALVRAIIPSTKIEMITRAEADGFYKVFLENGQIIYVNTFKRLIFAGEIYTFTGQNLTEADRNRWASQVQDEKTLKETGKTAIIADALKLDFGKGGNRYEFVIFTDPQCPFCKKAEEYFAQKDATLYVNYKPLVQIHEHAKDLSLQILSSKNPKSTIDAIHRTGKGDGIKITKEAEEKLDRMTKLADKLHIAGTPKIFVVEKDGNGVVGTINGADLKKIDEFLAKDKE